MNKPCSYQKIVRELRGEILAGDVDPRERLPTRRELMARFRTTPVTVNRALQVLAQHGFVEARGRHGTFVVHHPPHISHFAIAFPWGPDHAPSQFFRAIQAEAGKLQRPERHVLVFHGIEHADHSTSYQRLLSLATNHRIGGLIFAHQPLALSGSPLLEERGLPRVGIMLPHAATNFPTIYPDLDGFLAKAFAHLAAQGRRRIAVVMLATATPDAVGQQLIAKAGRYGLTIQPWWVQAANLEGAAWVQQSVHALLAAGRTERPDGLVIVDDNLVEPATRGVAAAKVRVPKELEIVAMTNFPWPMPTAVPVKRLGYDITRLVAVCLERLEQQARGDRYPRHTAITAVFEEEQA